MDYEKENDQGARLVEVEDVDQEIEIDKKKELSHSSINKKAQEIDQFMSGVSSSDSKIDRQMLRKSSRYSIMAGEHGLTVF